MAQITLNSSGVASNGTLALQSNGTTTAVTIDASQNVGIGTPSPTQKLHVNGNIRTTGEIATSAADFVYSWAGGTTGQIRSGFYLDGSNQVLRFYTAQADVGRFDSSGNLLVGVTSGSYHRFDKNLNGDWCFNVRNSGSSTPYGLYVQFPNASPNGTTNEFIYCADSTSLRMSVRSNGGIANYTANNSPLSDRRLKKNITPAGSYLDKICAIPVVTYFYNDQTDDLPNLGVIAQDVQLAAPELCNEEGWGTKAEDGSTYLGIWETDIQYALMKSIQELKAIVDAQAVEIAALKGTA